MNINYCNFNFVNANNKKYKGLAPDINLIGIKR